MSHIDIIKCEVTDLTDLAAAVQRLGGELILGQKTYRWYGRFMGDYPLPEGLTQKDLGKCTHAIRFQNATYEVGVLEKDGKYQLLWDFWEDGGLEKVIGPAAWKLEQSYSVCRTLREARRRKLKAKEIKTPTGIRIVLSGGR